MLVLVSVLLENFAQSQSLLSKEFTIPCSMNMFF